MKNSFFAVLSNIFKKRSKILSISMIILLIFGFLMIESASMGENSGDLSGIGLSTAKEIVIILISLLCYLTAMYLPREKFKLYHYTIVYVIMCISLLSTRAFGATNGAYAWIKLGFFTIQPSEFCKVFMIAYGAKAFGKDYHAGNIKTVKVYAIESLIMFLIILFYQHDTGSAMVLFGICYMILLVPCYKELRDFHIRAVLLMLLGIVLLIVAIFPLTDILVEKYNGSSYQILRFISAANPFKYQYDSGYHLVMSLATFASGGILGVGYGKSVHKYMNFPNPTNDFILPVIVEELGLVGFMALVILYAIILGTLMRFSLKINNNSAKIILFGTFAYIAMHFILNVGGVSGLLPLTGVPLLLVSSGGSSTMACLMALGLCQNEIIRYRLLKIKDKAINMSLVGRYMKLMTCHYLTPKMYKYSKKWSYNSDRGNCNVN